MILDDLLRSIPEIHEQPLSEFSTWLHASSSGTLEDDVKKLQFGFEVHRKQQSLLRGKLAAFHEKYTSIISCMAAQLEHSKDMHYKPVLFTLLLQQAGIAKNIFYSGDEEPGRVVAHSPTSAKYWHAAADAALRYSDDPTDIALALSVKIDASKELYKLYNQPDTADAGKAEYWAAEFYDCQVKQAAVLATAVHQNTRSALQKITYTARFLFRKTRDCNWLIRAYCDRSEYRRIYAESFNKKRHEECEYDAFKTFGMREMFSQAKAAFELFHITKKPIWAQVSDSNLVHGMNYYLKRALNRGFTSGVPIIKQLRQRCDQANEAYETSKIRGEKGIAEADVTKVCEVLGLLTTRNYHLLGREYVRRGKCLSAARAHHHQAKIAVELYRKKKDGEFLSWAVAGYQRASDNYLKCSKEEHKRMGEVLIKEKIYYNQLLNRSGASYCKSPNSSMRNKGTRFGRASCRYQT